MADPIIRLKRSAVAGKRPTLANLPLGEVALNTYDGRLFVRQDTGGVGIATTIRTVNPWSENFISGGEHSIYYDGGDVGIGTQNPTSTLDVNGTVTATSFVGNGSSITGITFGQLSDVTFTNVGQHDIAVYHDGEGWLNDPGASRVVQEVRNVTGIAITQAYPVYETGYNQGNERVTVDVADAGISTAMPALGIIHDADLGNNSNGYVIISGIADGIDTSGYTEGDELYVAVGGGLTNTRPTGATSLIQKIGTVLRSHATTGSILVQGAGRTNDVPNTISVSSSITAGDGFYGDGSGITGLDHSQVTGVITGLIVKEEGSVVGTAGSVAHLNFVSPNLTVTASGVGATLTLTDDPTFNSLDVTGIATATSFSGSGINLTGIVTSITAGDNISISTATGNVTITGLGNTANIVADTLVVTGVSTLGVVTGATYYGDGSNLTGITVDSSTTRTVNRYVATENQTLFPPTGTVSYEVGYVDVFLNGSKLDSTEFTATNGTTVTLTTGASVNDVLELVAFTNIGITTVYLVEDTSPQLGGDLDVNGFDITGTGDVNLTGVITATSFSGDGINLTGIVTSITAGDNISISTATGNVTITGIAATENVSTNSLLVTGISTFNGTGTEIIRVATQSPSASSQEEFGIGFAANVDDTNPSALITWQEFDDSDFRGELAFYTRTLTGDTVPTEKMRITKDGDIGIGTNNPNRRLDVRGSGKVAKFGTVDPFGDKIEISVADAGYPKILQDSSSDTLSLSSSGSIEVAIDSNNNSTGKVFNVVSNGDSGGGTDLLTINEDGNSEFSGIVTATSFVGDGSGLTNITHTQVGAMGDLVDDTTPQLGGNLDLNSNDITGTGDINITGSGTFSGSVSIAGTLTYEDVTNVDSVGLITARTGIDVSSGSITLKNGSEENSIRTNSSGQFQILRDSNTVALTIDDNSGRVGIATDNPGLFALDVRGTGQVARFGDPVLSNDALWIDITNDGYPALRNPSSTETLALRSSGGVEVSIDATNNNTNKVFTVVSNGHSGSGTELFRINESGQVGIGASSPNDLLHLSTSAGTDAVIKINEGTTSNSLRIGQTSTESFIETTAGHALRVGSNNTGTSSLVTFETKATERMRIDNAGNVGIGVSIPLQKFHVDGNTYIDGQLGIDQASPDSGTKFQINSSANWNFPPIFIQRDASNIASNIKMLAFGLEADSANQSPASSSCFIGLNIDSAPTTGDTVSSENARLNLTAPNGAVIPVGNLGIGVANPSEKLEVAGNLILDQSNSQIKLKSGGTGTTGAINFTFNTDSTVYAGLDLEYNTRASVGLRLFSNYPLTLESQASSYIAFRRGTTETARIDSSGNLGINETSPQTKLHVTGSNLSGAQYRTSATATLESNGSTELYLVSPNNNYCQIRFGDTDSNYRGAINYRHNTDSLDFVTAGSERLRIDSSGDANFLENISLLDSKKILLGTGDDLEIFHNGSSSVIRDNGTGNLFVQSNGAGIQLQKYDAGGSNENMARFLTDGAVELYYNNAKKFETTSTGVEVTGLLSATTKSFVIDHPTKEGMKLRHGSLEGPENGVYVRGRLKGNNTIELPNYWTGLVDEETITVNLTPIGRKAPLHSVVDIVDNTVVVESANDVVDCFYTVFGERKDVERFEVEY